MHIWHKWNNEVRLNTLTSSYSAKNVPTIIKCQSFFLFLTFNIFLSFHFTNFCSSEQTCFLMEGVLDEGTYSGVQMIPDTNADLFFFQQLFLLFQHCWRITITLREIREEKTFCKHVNAVLCRQAHRVKKKKREKNAIGLKLKLPKCWSSQKSVCNHLTGELCSVSCLPRSTAASSSTAKRWWTSTSTAWSSPCWPTRSTSSTAPRSRMRSKASSSGGPGGSGAAASRATVTSTTTVSGVCITRRRVRGRRGTMASVCRKMSLPARRCTPRSTSLRCSYTTSSSHKSTALPPHREDVTQHAAGCSPEFQRDWSDWLKPRRYSPPKHLAVDLKDLRKGR